ncbi:MAG: pyrimidine-nucleoside phosphorylase [Planctomycetota bacterium]
MRMVDIINKKRKGEVLTKQEIDFAIDGYTANTIPDYQMSAFAMAVCFQGMSAAERADLTMAMVKSGDQIDLSGIDGIKVDKHSTGGVGDTTTLVLAPLVASVGVPVAKMSGRGLGHTGGTIDKLESIAGFQVELDGETFNRLVNTNQIAIAGQSGNLTPADKKLYQLRDVTGTVDSISLIASSVMSKKIASGADAVVLDVKVGSGAFMKGLDEARGLARAMVRIGNEAGRRTIAVISDMNQPLGQAVGNALEVKEAIDTLKGHGPQDLYELCMVLGSQMAYLAEQADSIEQARAKLEQAMQSGLALEKFKVFVASQGGDVTVVDDPSRLRMAPYTFEVKAKQSGFISAIVADEIGISVNLLGAGRATKDSEIDLAVGLILNKKIGDKVEAGESLVTIHSNRDSVRDIAERIYQSCQISPEPVEPTPLVYDIISE